MWHSCHYLYKGSTKALCFCECRSYNAYSICNFDYSVVAPEVLYGQEYDHAADWWTLGILMYALLMGEFPINGPRDHREMGSAVARYTYGLPQYFKPEAKAVINKVRVV